MTDTPYQKVFTPISVGRARLRNRIVSTAHQTGLVREHLPTAELLAYHRERARGGIGAIFLEATAVHQTGLLTPKTLAGYLPAIPEALEPLVSAVHDEGAKVMVQLFHGGREQITNAPRPPAVGPSAVPSTRFHVEPRALSTAEIREIIDGYALSAVHMSDAGLDGVEISASHAYLPSQFFSARSNRRTDGYGPEHPLRFLSEVVAGVRERVGDGLAVGVRLALDEMSRSGLDEAACLDLAAEVESTLNIDFVSFTLGDSATFSGGAFIAPRPRSMTGTILDRLPSHRDEGAPVRLAATRVVDIDEAERAVAAGSVDLVGMTRAQIADPHLVKKVREGGAVIPCIGCNVGCIGHYHAGLPIACVMNQATGRETVLPQPRVRTVDPRPTRRRVAVVGAGVAGMSAAVEAAGAGHQVSVFEKDEQIGGQLRLAGLAPDHRTTWEAWRDWQERLVLDLGIDLRTGVEAGEGHLRPFDAVIDARGALPFREAVDDLSVVSQQIRVVDAWEFLRNPGTGSVVLVSDWAGEPAGLDCAELALEQGHKVHYAYAGATPAVNIHQYQRFGYLARLDVEDCTFHPATQAAVGESDVLVLRGSFSDRDRPIPEGIDTIVIAHGRVPGALPEESLGVRVGDLDGPRTLEEAALEGYLAAQGLEKELRA